MKSMISRLSKAPRALSELSYPLLAVLLLAAAFVVYANTFGNGWTQDDFPVLVNNPDIRSLAGFLRDSYPGRPLREITYLLDHALFGLNPAGYHIQQIFWHGLNAFLVLLLARRVFRLGTASSLIAGLLFLVHPVQVEVVANISHRKDSLVLAFVLLALLAYDAAFRNPRRRLRWLALAVAAAATALLAKQIAVALLPMCLAYEWVFVPREERMLMRRPWVWGAVVVAAAAWGASWLIRIDGLKAIYAAMRVTLLFHANYFAPPDFSAWYAMMMKSWLFLFAKLPLPAGLAAAYVYPVPASWLDPWVLGGLTLAAGYLLLLFLSLTRWPRLFFALVWIGCFFLPVANFLPFSYLAADRYLYSVSVGFFLLLALLVDKLAALRPATVITAFLPVFLLLACLTWRQSATWRSEETLFRRAVEVSPDSVFALNNLGWSLYQQGKTAEALQILTRATEVNPHFPKTFLNLAVIYEAQKNYPLAVDSYKKAVQESGNLPGFEDNVETIRKWLSVVYGVNLSEEAGDSDRQ